MAPNLISPFCNIDFLKKGFVFTFLVAVLFALVAWKKPPLGLTLQGLGVVLLVAGTVLHPEAWPAKVLRLAPIRFLGSPTPAPAIAAMAVDGLRNFLQQDGRLLLIAVLLNGQAIPQGQLLPEPWPKSLDTHMERPSAYRPLQKAA